jgi:hypothetical protein
MFFFVPSSSDALRIFFSEYTVLYSGYILVYVWRESKRTESTKKGGKKGVRPYIHTEPSTPTHNIAIHSSQHIHHQSEVNESIITQVKKLRIHYFVYRQTTWYCSSRTSSSWITILIY